MFSGEKSVVDHSRIRSGFCGNSAMGSKDQKEKLYSVYELREMQLVSKKILYNYLRKITK